MLPVLHLSFLVFLCTLTVFAQTTVRGDADGIINSTSHEMLQIQLFEYETLNYTLNCTSLDSTIYIKTHDINIGGILTENALLPVERATLHCLNGSTNLPVKAGHLGITHMSVFINCSGLNTTQNYTISFSVLRKITLFDKIALFSLGPLILLNKCAFGAKIELDVLKRVVTHPIELCLCLLTQFVFMPLVAVFLGVISKLDEVMALALLVSAACPGGGGGYVFSFLIDGDITLAITASLVSTLVAMVAMPSVIGLYTLAADIPNDIKIPYVDIMLMLLAIATPISFGMFLRKQWPDFAKKLIIIIRPLSLFLIAGGFVVVLVTSRYILYGPKIGILLAHLVPLSGFVIATGLARCFCINWPLSKAVGLESGLKNTVLGVAVIELSFPQPQADLASILIVMITVGQVVVSMTWYILYLIKTKLQSKNERSYVKFRPQNNDDSFETELFLGQT